jgi:hypothetical protein
MFKPKVKVHLWSGLRNFVDGAAWVEVEARNVGEMLDALVRDHPALDEIIDDGAGVSVSIDGRIYADSLIEPVDETKEIYLMQKLKGG